jgi:hypothetical protein
VDLVTEKHPVRFIDWYLDTMDEIHERLSDALDFEELSYDEGIVVKNAHLQEARWMEASLVHGAVVDVFEARHQRVKTELNFYRDRQALDEIDPADIMDAFEQEDAGDSEGPT